MAYGAGQIANQYIDQEIQTQKAQAIADIQRNSAIKLDEYNLSPDRQKTVRQNATDATIAEAAAKDTSSLASYTNKPLIAARNTAEASDPIKAATIKHLEAQADQARAYARLADAGGRGAANTTVRKSMFDAKELDDALAKIEPALVSMESPTNPDKLVEIRGLRDVYRNAMMEGLNRGNVGLHDAENTARARVQVLRDEAQKRVDVAKKDDPKTPFNEAAAVRQILAEVEEDRVKTLKARPIALDPASASNDEGTRASGRTPEVMAQANARADQSLADKAKARASGVVDSSASVQDQIQAAQKPQVTPGLYQQAVAERNSKAAKADADPDIIALMKQRDALLRGGARGATIKVNALNDQINELRKQRYGL
jgi:hypothetical protein